MLKIQKVSFSRRKNPKLLPEKRAGRKTKFASPLKFQIRVTKEEKEFLTIARNKKLNFATLMNLALKAD